MILSFHIEYRTSWGEEVRVLGSILELGNNQPGKGVPLQTVDGIHWTLDADIQAPENGFIRVPVSQDFLVAANTQAVVIVDARSISLDQ